MTPERSGCRNCVTFYGLVVFEDQAREPVPAQNAYIGHSRRRIRTAGMGLCQTPGAADSEVAKFGRRPKANRLAGQPPGSGRFPC